MLSLFYNCFFYPYYFSIDNTKRTIISKNIIESELPYNKYKIITSHNTFVKGFQLLDFSTVDAIKNALYTGSRVIELDIHPSVKNKNIPIVSHAAKIFGILIYFTTPLSLEDCLNVVNDFSYITSDPIVIFLELETDDNNILQTNVANIIKKIFGNKLLDNKYKLCKNLFFLEPIKNLLNKIIIIAGASSKQIIGMEDVIDCTLYQGQIINKDHIYSKNINNTNKPILSRVYRKGSILSELSLNFEPYPYWIKHHQLVAINIQKNDIIKQKYLDEFNNTSFLPLPNI